MVVDGARILNRFTSLRKNNKQLLINYDLWLSIVHEKHQKGNTQQIGLYTISVEVTVCEMVVMIYMMREQSSKPYGTASSFVPLYIKHN